MASRTPQLEKQVTELFKEVLDFRDSEKFKKLIRFTTQLRTIGSYNAMLVSIQGPGVKFVYSQEDWLKLHGRVLKPNPRPYMILTPFGPVSFVFDVSDTRKVDGLPENEDDFLEELSEPYKAIGYIEPKLKENLINNLKFFGIEYAEDYVSSKEETGYIIPVEFYYREDSIIRWGRKHKLRFPVNYLLSINVRRGKEEQFISICHELAHFFCYHLDPPYVNGEPLWDKRRLTTVQQEFEAETVAWILAVRNGIHDSGSVQYLAKYVGVDGQLPEVNIGNIMSAADSITRMISEEKWDIKKCWVARHYEDFNRAMGKLTKDGGEIIAKPDTGWRF